MFWCGYYCRFYIKVYNQKLEFYFEYLFNIPNRRWHYSLLSHTEMVISIEKSHIVFIGGDNPLAIPLPERMSLITNTIIDEYELKLSKLTKENQKLKEEIQSILRGSSSNILSEEEIDFPDQVDSLFRQSSEDTIINEDSIRHFDAEGEPWSLIECVESVFIPGTVHYLSTGLLVNSLSNSREYSIFNVLFLLFNF